MNLNFQLIWFDKKSRKRPQRSAICVHERLALKLRFLASGDSTLACSTSSKFPKSTPFHNYQHAQETTKHYILAPFFKTEALGRKRRAEEWTVVTLRVTLPVHTYSDRNRIIPLMRRRNTDSAPNKPVTWPRNQLLIRYAVTSSVHTVTIRCEVTR